MKSKWWLLLFGVAVVAIVVAVVQQVAGREPDDRGDAQQGTTLEADEPAASTSTPTPSMEPTPDPSPVPSPAPTIESLDVGGDGSALVEPFVLAESTSRESPETSFSLDEVAIGMALEDLTLAAFEFAENGIVQVGSPTIVSAEVMESDESAAPPVATVQLCLDYSEVGLETPSGESVKDPHAPSRVPSIVTLNRVDGRWLVSERTFPDEPTC